MFEPRPRIYNQHSSDQPGSQPEQPGIQNSEVQNRIAAALTVVLQDPSPPVIRAMAIIIDNAQKNQDVSTHNEHGQDGASTSPLDTPAE